MLVLGMLGESWGASCLQEGGLADLALDIHGLHVLWSLLALVPDPEICDFWSW